MSENKTYTVLTFIILAIWVCLPPALFLLGVASKPLAYMIFVAFALPVIIYCLIPAFRGKGDSGAKTNQLYGLPGIDFSGFNSAESEIETVQLSRKR